MNLFSPAFYNLKKVEKRRICESLTNIKVPDDYSSNIRNLVSIKDLRLISLKSYDCHTLIQQLLPIALWRIDQKHVRFVITKLCLVFNAICVKTVDISRLKAIQEEIVLTLCLFEQYFPSSFFDIMIHLTVHLVRKIELCGPMYMHWMYSFERLMKILKGYVRN